MRAARLALTQLSGRQPPLMQGDVAEDDRFTPTTASKVGQIPVTNGNGRQAWSEKRWLVSVLRRRRSGRHMPFQQPCSSLAITSPRSSVTMDDEQ